MKEEGEGEEQYEVSDLADEAKELAGNALKHVDVDLLEYCRLYLHNYQ